MKIAIITPYPPSLGTLNEYAFHLVKSFVQNESIEEIFILSNHLEDDSLYKTYQEPKMQIIPCWTFNSLNAAIEINQTLHKLKVDAVIYNLQFMTFGENKIPAALGLLSPWLSRIQGKKSIVLLHNIVEAVKLDTIGMSNSKWKLKLMQWIGTQLTKYLLKANLVSVTVNPFVNILKKKYRAKNVVMIPHGNFDAPPRVKVKDVDQEIHLMTFGKFGTYKKVEIVLEAAALLKKKYPTLHITTTIAGTDNPNVKGYLQKVKNQYSEVEDVHFTGYVAEEDVPKLFTDSTMVIFPYSTTTGSSGILHQAGSYARACVLPLIDDFKTLVEEEGYAGSYFKPEDTQSLVDAISSLIDQPALREAIETQNYQAAQGLPMSKIAEMYIHEINKLLHK